MVVVFSYTGANGPESSMTLHFEEVHQVAVPVGRETTTVFGRVKQNAAPGGAVCYLQLCSCLNDYKKNFIALCETTLLEVMQNRHKLKFILRISAVSVMASFVSINVDFESRKIFVSASLISSGLPLYFVRHC